MVSTLNRDVKEKESVGGKDGAVAVSPDDIACIVEHYIINSANPLANIETLVCVCVLPLGSLCVFAYGRVVCGFDLEGWLLRARHHQLGEPSGHY